MLRRIAAIDREACDGCGLCVSACREGAVIVQDGKALLTRDDYCDGLGNCLPACPRGAIRLEEREASAYDEEAVRAHAAAYAAPFSPLQNWPVQLQLVPPAAPWLRGADLLLSADCCAYAYPCGGLARGKKLLIGCPKLDNADYRDKLAAIFAAAVKSLTILRMEVPCCAGLVWAAQEARAAAAPALPCRVLTFSIEGRLLKDERL